MGKKQRKIKMEPILNGDYAANFCECMNHKHGLKVRTYLCIVFY